MDLTVSTGVTARIYPCATCGGLVRSNKNKTKKNMGGLSKRITLFCYFLSLSISNNTFRIMGMLLKKNIFR